MNILTVNLLFSTLVFWIAARIYVFPKLNKLNPQTIMPPSLATCSGFNVCTRP